MKPTADLLIVGAGMVGAATACMLARAGFSVQVLEQQPPAKWSGDAPVGLRVSALSPGSQHVLTEAGVWASISAQRACAYRRMRIEDGDDRVVLDFNAGEFALERLGSIVENDLLQQTLWQHMHNLSGVEVICPAAIREMQLDLNGARVDLIDGRQLHAPLLVGADGAASSVRRAMGVDQQLWTYSQQGIVCVVQTAIPNQGMAWQRFMPGGPLALLPLQDGSSSIVWSRPDHEAAQLLGMDDAGFLAKLQEATAVAAGQAEDGQSLFGEIVSCGPRAAFPLSMALADRYAATSSVLVGDAAHVVHPLAGQGVNLGFLDAAALVETSVNNRKAGRPLNDERSLAAYSRARRSETELMARGIHGLRSLFAAPPLAPLRRIGLGLISKSWHGKEAFIRRATGLHAGAPAIARGMAIGQLMR
jgi:2-octaprenylphenol hydroxylase